MAGQMDLAPLLRLRDVLAMGGGDPTTNALLEQILTQRETSSPGRDLARSGITRTSAGAASTAGSRPSGEGRVGRFAEETRGRSAALDPRVLAPSISAALSGIGAAIGGRGFDLGSEEVSLAAEATQRQAQMIYQAQLEEEERQRELREQAIDAKMRAVQLMSLGGASKKEMQGAINQLLGMMGVPGITPEHVQVISNIPELEAFAGNMTPENAAAARPVLEQLLREEKIRVDDPFFQHWMQLIQSVEQQRLEGPTGGRRADFVPMEQAMTAALSLRDELGLEMSNNTIQGLFGGEGTETVHRIHMNNMLAFIESRRGLGEDAPLGDTDAARIVEWLDLPPSMADLLSPRTLSEISPLLSRVQQKQRIPSIEVEARLLNALNEGETPDTDDLILMRTVVDQALDDASLKLSRMQELRDLAVTPDEAKQYDYYIQLVASSLSERIKIYKDSMKAAGKDINSFPEDEDDAITQMMRQALRDYSARAGGGQNANP
jgi:hypothetical protein